jgi:hypothetical protein
MALKNEDIEQINLINWLRFNYPEIEKDTYHIPLQRKCSIQQGSLLKKMGVKRGMADLFIAIPQNGKSGLWIELKSEKGKLSLEQKEFLSRMTINGYVAVSVCGFEAAKETIIDYLKPYIAFRVKN